MDFSSGILSPHIQDSSSDFVVIQFLHTISPLLASSVISNNLVKFFVRDRSLVHELSVQESLDARGGSGKHKVTDFLNARAFWDKGCSGKGIRIGVFDTGLKAHHPAIRNIKERTNWTNERKLDDSIGHGTFSSGVIAGSDENCLGFAPNAEMYIFRVFDDSQTSRTSWFLEAFNYALTLGLDIVNLSIGGPDFCDKPFVDKVQELISTGVVFVSSVGNDGPGYGSLSNPADMAEVIAVGSVSGWDFGTNLHVSKFSSRGMSLWELPHGVGRVKPDLLAPGENLVGPTIAGRGCRKMSGTSVAAPVVSGVIALLVEYLRDSGIDNINPGLIRSLLWKGSRVIRDISIFEQGAGVLEGTKLLQAADAFIERNADGGGAVVGFFPPHFLLHLKSYMWPWSSQPLFFTSSPLVLNLSLSTSCIRCRSVRLKRVDSGDENDNNNSAQDALLVRFSSINDMYPYGGTVSISFSLTHDIDEPVLVRSVYSIVLSDGSCGSAQFRISLPLVPTPPRSKRVLWDQFHNIQYPPAYVPRDYLRSSSSLLDSRGDHLYTNFRMFHRIYVERGYFFDVATKPLSCINLELYKTIVIADPEDFFFDEEISVLTQAEGLNLFVLADWGGSNQLINALNFVDTNGVIWKPIIGGANIAGLNALLSGFGVEFGHQFLSGPLDIAPYAITFASMTTRTKKRSLFADGAPIIAVPSRSHLMFANLADLEEFHIHPAGAGVGGMDDPLRVTAPIMALIEHSKNSKIALFGDSSCLEDTLLDENCLWVVDVVLDYFETGIAPSSDPWHYYDEPYVSSLSKKQRKQNSGSILHKDAFNFFSRTIGKDVGKCGSDSLNCSCLQYNPRSGDMTYVVMRNE